MVFIVALKPWYIPSNVPTAPSYHCPGDHVPAAGGACPDWYHTSKFDGALTEFPLTVIVPPLAKFPFFKYSTALYVTEGLVNVQNPGSCRNANPTNHCPDEVGVNV
jgi:hypothetical protein